jgi:choline-sulfatase
MTPQPHILLLMADQLSARALPAYGNAVVRAPHLERLGEEGVVFERALCASPLCVPSRASLLTGLLPSRTGAYDNAGELPASVPTFAHHLRALGYRTVLAGKMHFIGPDQLHGFEERPLPDVYPAGLDWIPDWRLTDDQTLPWYHDLSSVLRAGPIRRTLQIDYDAEVAEHARRAIEETARGDARPLFLVASFTHPHDPYEVPADCWSRYENVEIDPPAHPEPPEPIDAPTRRLRAMVSADTIEVTPAQALLARRGYYGAVSLVDDHIGSLLDALSAHGLADETVVLVTSDHGDMLGERGLWYKMAPFEDSIRVPLVVHAPSRFAPRRIDDPVSLLDIMPALVEVGGGIAPSGLDGSSLAPALSGSDPPTRHLPLEYLAEGVHAPQVTVVHGALKLVRSLGEPDLLFDLATDPGERVDLAGDPLRAHEARDLAAAADKRWDLGRLDAEVRASQERRRLVAQALAEGARAIWDLPTEQPDGPYIRSGQDFWQRLESAREP